MSSPSELRERFKWLMMNFPETAVEEPLRSRRFEGIRELTRQPLYAIPSSILECLNGRLPKFLTKTELEKERRFSTYCESSFSLGLFRGKFIRHLTLSRLAPCPIDEVIFRQLGLDPQKSLEAKEQLFRSQAESFKPFAVQLEGYMGWMMTDPRFIQERDALRNKWGKGNYSFSFPNSNGVASIFKLPRDRPPYKPNPFQELASDFAFFYKRWQLSQLITWDLPQPIGANIGGPAWLGKLVGVEESPALQLSPILRFPARCPLKELMRGRLDEHLAEWKKVLDQRHPKHYGFDRFGRIFHLHFYRNIVLGSRYGDRFHRQKEALDAVFSGYFEDRNDQNVKRLRQWTDKQLKV